MFIVITLILIMDVCIFIAMGSMLTKPKGNIVMGATLPTEQVQNQEISNIIKKFKKSNWLFIIFSSIAIMPSYVGDKYPAFSIIYFIIYLLVVYFAFQANFYRYVVQVRHLKRQNDWFIKKDNITYVDTEVAKLKNKMIVKQYWFIPTLIVYAIAFIFKLELMQIISSMISSITCYVFYLIYKNKRSKVYSKDSEINIACNNIERRAWSIIWMLFSFLSSLVVFSNVHNEFLVLILLSSVIALMLLAVFYAHNRIRETQNKLLSADKNIIVNDDDEYWGMFIYNNPNDTRTFVDKRYGIGTTINFGSKIGKRLVWGFVIFMIITMAPCIAIVAVLSNADYSMAIKNNQVVIDAPMYGMKFDIDKIKSIKTIKKLPDGYKSNGASTSKIALGHFDLNGYGKSDLYIKRNIHKIIVIKLKDTTVFINGASYDETNKYYDELVKGGSTK